MGKHFNSSVVMFAMVRKCSRWRGMGLLIAIFKKKIGVICSSSFLNTLLYCNVPIYFFEFNVPLPNYTLTHKFSINKAVVSLFKI